MKIKALKPFCGTVTMGVGEEKEVPDSTARELIAAGHATACVADRQFDEALLKETEKPEEAEEDSAESEESENSEVPQKTTKKAAAKK